MSTGERTSSHDRVMQQRYPNLATRSGDHSGKSIKTRYRSTSTANDNALPREQAIPVSPPLTPKYNAGGLREEDDFPNNYSGFSPEESGMLHVRLPTGTRRRSLRPDEALNARLGRSQSTRSPVSTLIVDGPATAPLLPLEFSEEKRRKSIQRQSDPQLRYTSTRRND
jgi:hypothetical protein